MAKTRRPFLVASPAAHLPWSIGCEDGRGDDALGNLTFRLWLANALRGRIVDIETRIEGAIGGGVERITRIVLETPEGTMAYLEPYAVAIEAPEETSPQAFERAASAVIRGSIMRGWLALDLDGPDLLVQAARDVIARRGPDIVPSLQPASKDGKVCGAPEEETAPDEALATKGERESESWKPKWQRTTAPTMPAWMTKAAGVSPSASAPPPATDGASGRKRALWRAKAIGTWAGTWYIDRRKPFWDPAAAETAPEMTPGEMLHKGILIPPEPFRDNFTNLRIAYPACEEDYQDQLRWREKLRTQAERDRAKSSGSKPAAWGTAAGPRPPSDAAPQATKPARDDSSPPF